MGRYLDLLRAPAPAVAPQQRCDQSDQSDQREDMSLSSLLSPSIPSTGHRNADPALIEVPSAAERAAAIWGEIEEERVAIIEHDGAVSRKWAEGFARLDPDRPSGDVPLRRWRMFVDDVGRFLDSPFCAVAAALGWGPYDLFGCDRDRPFARIDQCGLLWLVNGRRLIALTAETAIIETGAGHLTYRRKPATPGQVLVWELLP